VWTYDKFKARLAARFAPPSQALAARTRPAHPAQAGTVADYVATSMELTSLATGSGNRELECQGRA